MLRALVAIKAGIPVVQTDRLRTPPKANIKPFPRPVTALEEARERAAREAARQVLAWFFPHAAASDN